MSSQSPASKNGDEGTEKKRPVSNPKQRNPYRPKDALRLIKEIEKAKKGKTLSADASKKLESAVATLQKMIDDKASEEAYQPAVDHLLNTAELAFGWRHKGAFREYFESIGTAVLIAFLLRAFVVEAFKIPTGSMIPTLMVGDHIFVNKFTYGLRVPLTNRWISQWSEPSRGDVIVFKYPVDPSKDYIKRVVAVSGDRVQATRGEVHVNGKKLERIADGEFVYTEQRLSDPSPSGLIRRAFSYSESSVDDSRQYDVLYEVPPMEQESFPNGETLDGLDCGPVGGSCMVKPGFVFVMGDNRDNSADSRKWGGVPLAYVKGRAMVIWWSRSPLSGIEWNRIGKLIP
jgi:signal peptidase I